MYELCIGDLTLRWPLAQIPYIVVIPQSAMPAQKMFTDCSMWLSPNEVSAVAIVGLAGSRKAVGEGRSKVVSSSRSSR